MRKRALVLVATTVGFFIAISPSLAGDVAADAIEGDTGVEGRHQEALKALALLLPRDHISRQPLDKEMARRWFHNFVDAIDPHRMVFTAGDIRQFAERSADLDDQARRGDLSFARFVRNVYLFRLDRSVRWADNALDQPHDFTVDEQFELRPDKFVADVAALRDRWRKRIKYEMLVEKSAGLTKDGALTKLRQRYRRIARDRQIGNEELYEIFLNALARAYGPNTAYLGERSLQRFRL